MGLGSGAPFQTGCRVTGVAATITTGTLTYLPFVNTPEDWDTDEMHSTTVNTGRITCKTPGKYLCVFACEFGATATKIFQLMITLNAGRTIIASNHCEPYTTAGSTFPNQVVTIIDLIANDYIEACVYHNVGANAQVNYAVRHSPVFMAQRIG